MQIKVDPGTEKWIKWARLKLRQLTSLRKEINLPSMIKFYQPEAGTLVHLKSTDWENYITITGRTTGTLFELIDVGELDLTTPIDPVLLDADSTNYGLVLPSNCKKTDNSFNTALIINPSFAIQKPAQYVDIDKYLLPTSLGFTLLRGNEFAYLQDLDFGTMVQVKALTELPGPVRNLYITWISNIRNKSGSPEFIPYAAGAIDALPVETDYLISLAVHDDTGFLNHPAIGSDGWVTIASPIGTTGWEAVAYAPGQLPQPAVIISGGTVYAAAVCRKGLKHYLAAGFYNTVGLNNIYSIVCKDSDGVVLSSDSFIITTGTSSYYPVAVKITNDSFVVAIQQDSTSGISNSHLRTSTGLYSVFIGSQQGQIIQSTVDVNSDGLPACIATTGNFTTDVIVQIGNTTNLLLHSFSFPHEIARLMGGAWTPDGRYYFAQCESACKVYTIDGTVIHSGVGTSGPAIDKLFIESVSESTVESVTTRRYKIINTQSFLGNAAAFTTIMTVVEQEGGIEATFEVSEIIERIWGTAAFGSAVDDIRRTVL